MSNDLHRADGNAAATATATIPPTRGRILRWASWDWGSAAFNAVTTTFVYTVWLTSTAFIGDHTLVDHRNADKAAGLTSSPAIDQVEAILAQHSSWLGLGLSLAGLVVALLAPVLGHRSDESGNRRRNLGITTFGTVICMIAMWFVQPDPDWLFFGIALIAVGNIFFELASAEYNALLPGVSSPKDVGRVSGIGWGMGYIGGIVLLAIVLVGFINPEVGWFGVGDENGTRYRAVALLAALWFAVFALPTLLQRDGLPEPARASGTHTSFFGVYRELGRTIARLWRSARSTLVFLIASAVYRDGLAGVFTFGGVLAAGTFGFSSSEVIVFAIAANVVSGIATMLLGMVEDRVGPRVLITVSLIGMIAAALLTLLTSGGGKTFFWIFGMLMCVFVGPVQSASRSFLTSITPAGRHGEIFGLYATTGRAVSFLAPAAFSVTVALLGAQIWGILGIAAVLLVGLVLFTRVHVAR
ncbi:MFS transporter [Pseudoclavibacter sp. CFCC 11306]|uniref:MFS transporter n=1 Tax=Pseudoclavibacter sp. CFCC 11306 TaxID=1564493 RepID=UPI0013012634|nr:MFS transporter [Pseudoclavibacter sp. CFCC 11306]KAB1657566.1 MFS transporter [Pseudoclavibacter sp. CFCC 11306]